MRKKVFIVVILIAFSLGQAFAASCGDVNANGEADIVDALLIAQYAVGLYPANFDSSVADVNGDADINIVDALRVAQYSVGLVSQLSCPSTSTPDPTSPPASGGPNTMGYCGCSMAENVANGYRAVGGQRMWGGYGTGGMVVQNWTDPNSSSWQLFDQQSARYGKPSAVWVQVCIFPQGATYDEVKQMIAAAKQHAAPGATIYITGQPLYPEGNVCTLAGGADGPPSTDRLAQQAGNDSSLNVIYSGTFTLRNSEVADGCHANSAGEQALGNQAVEKWGR
ncbi:MAG: dockerin type I repeat-containing protein [Spirochaetales bacterium]|nr:dockerin type I repeat-containing protein [Spirochaetales bacterium]